jgi:hypothetical protein
MRTDISVSTNGIGNGRSPSRGWQPSEIAARKSTYPYIDWNQKVETILIRPDLCRIEKVICHSQKLDFIIVSTSSEPSDLPRFFQRFSGTRN